MGIAKDYRKYSYWLETCGDDLTPRSQLDGSIDCDVAILGAGYTGLWTAYYLLKRDPSLKIVVVEAEIAGFGASGRNGAWCSSGFPLGLTELETRFGRDVALDVHQAVWDTVDEVGRVAEVEGFDIEWRKGGSLRLARGTHQQPGLQAAMKTYERFGIADDFQLLDEHGTAERVRVTKVLGSIYSPQTATIHPAKLVRGLARVVERLGGTIYEGTRVTDFSTGAYPVLHTERGHVRAKTIVLAGEAYLTRLRKTHRLVLPAYSLITLTEPLSPSEWAQIGWEANECIGSMAFMVNYLSKTSDGRIMFGGRGAPYHFGSSIKDEYDRHGPTHAMLQDNVREWFPVLQDVKFTHTWGGALGWSRDYMPWMRFDPREGVAMAGGYTGQGVAPSNLSGRVLADLITRTDSDLVRLPVTKEVPRHWEPEPLRFLGVRFVQRGFAKLDAKAEATGVPPNGKSLAERLTRH